MFITIFTPTFNRAHTLPILYQSLLKQTDQSFEWLIIDDGSTDETQELIKKYQAEKKILIKQYAQHNQGKHIAINKALELAKGKYFLVIDSDDYLEDFAVETSKRIALEIEGNDNLAGFSFIHCSDKIVYKKEEFGKKRWTKLHDYEWKFKGEMQFVLKTNFAREFKFPVFKDEKFCQEAVYYLPLLRKYKILYTDNILAHGDYLDDGLSHNLYKRLLENPRYAMLSYKEKINSYGTAEEKLQMAKIYWDIAQKSPHISIYEKVRGLPLKWTIKVFLNKYFK